MEVRVKYNFKKKKFPHKFLVYSYEFSIEVVKNQIPCKSSTGFHDISCIFSFTWYIGTISISSVQYYLLERN